MLEDPSLFLDSYAGVVSQRAGDEGRDASRLFTTMRVLATLESEAVPDQRIWEAADINKATWKAYDDLLVRTHLTTPTPSFTSNRLKRLTTFPKRYLADVALASQLAGLDLDRLRADPTLAGRYVESLVVQQLRPQADQVGASLTHLRTAAGEREIDAIVEVGSDVVAFEVKHRTTIRRQDGKHLIWLRDQLGDRFRTGFVVHSGGDTYPIDDRIMAVPFSSITGGDDAPPGPSPP